MDLLPSADQLALRDELRRFLVDRCGSEQRRAGFDRALFGELAGLGVFGLLVPEADGGLGFGRAEATIVFEELGRAAVPGPVLATCLAGGRVAGAIEGSTVVGLGSPAPDGTVVLEHPAAVDVAVLVRDELRLLAPVPPAGLSPRPLDPLTPVGWLPAGLEGTELESAEGVWQDGALLIAALQIGLGQSALELAVAHALDREQFGRPIGTFQAVKHQLADAAVGLEAARAGLHQAAVTLDEGGDADGRLAFGARIVASEAADRSCRASIQVHGGMGFTWELDVHLFFKRVVVLDAALGGVELAVTRVARTLAS